MAASRRGQKFGISIFDRVRGLLRSGAWSVENKPIWYEVYRKFPPQFPSYDRKKSVPDILYPEDMLRKKFQSVFGHLMYRRPEVTEQRKKDNYGSYIYDMDLTDIHDQKSKSIEQRFVEKYFELQKNGVPPENIFEQTASFFRLNPSSEISEFNKKEQKIRVREVEELLEEHAMEKNPKKH